MLFCFELTVTGISCSADETMKTLEVFVQSLEDRSFTVRTSEFRHRPADGTAVLHFVVYGHQAYVKSLNLLREAIAAMPGEKSSLTGVYDRSIEISGSFDAERNVAGWTKERQQLAFHALFRHFRGKGNREIATLLGIGIGTVQRYRKKELRKIRQETLRHIITALINLDPSPPQALIDTFEIMLTSDDEGP